jgi:hypothetical protein
MANNLFVSYELRRNREARDAVLQLIHEFGNSANVHGCLWYVHSTCSAKDVCDSLCAVMNPDDSLMVIDATNVDAAWQNVDSEVAQFILDHWTRYGRTFGGR